MRTRGASYWLLYLLLPAAILLIWELAAVYGFIKPYAMPSPEAMVKVTSESWAAGTLLTDLSVSVVRVLKGFFLALVTAFLLGLGSAIFSKLEVMTDLVLQLVRPIPPIAWIPLAILWFGIGEESKVFIIYLGAFFPIYVNIMDGIKSIDSRYLELADVYEIPRLKRIAQVILPAALPSIMTGVRLGLGNAWVCVVAAEMIGAVQGVGFMLANGRSLSRPDLVILGMLLVGIVGKIMDDFLRLLRKRLVTWI